jgi:hypothetical protein
VTVFAKGKIMIHTTTNDMQSYEYLSFLGYDTMQFGREMAANITAFINAILTNVNEFHSKMTTSFHHKYVDYFIHKIFQYTSPAQTPSTSKLFTMACFCPQNASLKTSQLITAISLSSITADFPQQY